MLGWLFGDSKKIVNKVNHVVDVDVDVDVDGNRYPPFVEGIPVTPTENMIAAQRVLIERIRMSLGFTKEEFDRIVFPVIHNYAAFVHVLPASESYHHSGTTGLFRHGLEVAFRATQASEAVIFTIDGSPMERRNTEPRWRLASCLAGLLHDAAKPITDLVIVGKNGEPEWDPHAETIHEWAKKNNISNYFIQWRKGRHQKHEESAKIAAKDLLPVNTVRYLNTYGKDPLLAMYDAVARNHLTQPITRLTQKADEESVKNDLVKSNSNQDKFDYAVPVEIFVTDAVRRLINSGKWKINQPGSKVWYFEQGAFIAWRQIDDIYQMMEKDGRQGVPRDPDMLAEMLINRNFAIENETNEKGGRVSYRYWEVQPEILQKEESKSKITLLMLRIADSDNIFTVDMPNPVKATIIGEESSEALVKDINTEDPEPDEGGDVEDGDSSAETGLQESKRKQSKETNTHKVKEYEALSENTSPEGLKAIKSSDQSSLDIDFPFNAFGLNEEREDVDSPNEKPIKAHDPVIPVKHEVNKKTTKEQSKNTLKGQIKPTGNGEDSTRIATPDEQQGLDVGSIKTAKASSDNIDPKEEISVLIKGYGDASEMLKAAIMPVLEGKKNLGDVIVLIKGVVGILHPQGTKKIGDPSKVLTVLSESDAVSPDPIMPGRKIRDYNGTKIIVFADPLSNAVIKAIKQVEEKYNLSITDSTALTAAQKVMPEKPQGVFSVPTSVKVKPSKKMALQNKKITDKKEKKQESKALKTTNHTRNNKKDKVIKKSVSENASREKQNHMSKPLDSNPKKKFKVSPENKKSAMQKENTFPESREKNDKACDSVDLDILPAKKKLTAVTAIKELKEMIIRGEGDWLVSEVIEEKGYLVTSDKALEMIVAQNTGMAKHPLRGIACSSNMTIKQGSIYLRVKNHED